MLYIYISSEIDIIFKLFNPEKILSFDIHKQPIITKNSNNEFIFKADSNSNLIKLIISL